MASKREDIIEATCQLIEFQGYQATGLNQIVKKSGAPKGSLYYYFPDGKDELIEAAITRNSTVISKRLQASMDAHEKPADAIPTFLRNLAHFVQESGFQSGGPISAVALEVASTNERLNTACRNAYRDWQAVIEQKLLASQYEPVRAKRMATIVIAIIEGATILSRSERNVGPLLDAAIELEAIL